MCISLSFSVSYCRKFGLSLSENIGCISPSLSSIIHVSPNIELKQIHTLTEMDACTCSVPLYMYVHVHVYQNNVDERID